MTLSGKRISKGIGIGEVLCIRKNFDKIISREKIDFSQVDSEISKFNKAKSKAIEALRDLERKAMLQFGDDKKGIFEGQVLIVEDDELDELVIELIVKENYSAAYSIYLAFENLVKSVEDYKDPYLKERASDYKDIRNRLISIILGQVSDFSEINKDIVLVTEELTPSDTMQFDLNYVKGFLTAVGGETSHAAILARTMGLPALVMTLSDIDALKDGDKIVIDAMSSIVIKNPSSDEINLYEGKILRQVELEKELFSLKDKDAETKDGTKVFLKANIGTPVDITYVNKYGVEGIGLFRTEFLYMRSLQPPTEDEQFETYKRVIETMEKKGVVTIRTLDVGGDKEIPYLNFKKEENPFLGFRALRMYKEYEELIQAQFNAIFRASHYGKIRVMVPMLTIYEEIETIEYFVNNAKINLKSRGLPFDENLEVGCMIEVPSAALISSKLANKLKFFSIGTNDLTQYVLAVDRGNQKISNLYDKYNPAVLKLIKKVLDDGVSSGIDVSVCGELGGDDAGALLLVGLGFRSLSMIPSATLRIKYLLKKHTIMELEELANKVLNSDSKQETLSYFDKFIGD
ncbi:phosphoenolpyruvate-protein phosphotransferase [Borreliella burgdorferi 29805]|uniref:phosphoenolpyruvate--protein phosphotransferase n=1 Tax=Borreliella burgdorferi TaxID=139 RepID=UPI00017F447E|nr:phosphoenolpyruvate--protein phosphotransferase [Borreliella burgdorferi]EEH32284.1 phosphoenolpyruvate-protein phosphotransferase [Borreliella burgdorferi 29805]MCD2319414.1 phosphoenolpyruvate--protein phosphotransferase [Borreliella burgdorferi]MCD2372777.1 phosphoenolpyruvate--protein phosphotransferase [Borreliella burgdorferi]MCD2376446.1 phosphoenolpyruvate--protein phosphotransferase [Borreliella burgdorferi]MCD2377103.1 phosphoenolpyruvate--protein phosphotransferase [Borreliella b